jgi:predicted Zn-ribbon and HTH transcriptional regulator
MEKNKMIDALRNNIMRLWRNELSSTELLKILNLNEEQISEQIIKMLDKSLKNKDADLCEDAIYLICIYDKFLNKYVTRLNKLLIKNWHKKHEDIASLLQDARSPSSIENLYKTVYARYEYLDYDEAYALAVKCIWALGDIGNDDAKDKLKQLTFSENEIINKNAKYQIERLGVKYE